MQTSFAVTRQYYWRRLHLYAMDHSFINILSTRMQELTAHGLLCKIFLSESQDIGVVGYLYFCTQLDHSAIPLKELGLDKIVWPDP